MHRRWTVGALAEMLQIAAPTLRTWDRRYGIGPSYRTAGGHRRYTIIDADRVATMARFIADGMPAKDAAELVKRMPPHELASLVAGQIRGRSSAREYAFVGILTGAREFDGARVQASADEVIERFGVADAWDSTIAPALIEVGRQWADGRLSVAAEHLVTARLLAAMRAEAHRHHVTGPAHVVLASVEDEQHKLPLVALGAALAAEGLASTELGARLPLDALEAFVETTEPQVSFLWCSVATPSDEAFARVRGLGSRTHLLLGGPGWPEGVDTVPDLTEALRRVRTALGDELP